MAGITSVSGLVSGIDTASLVSQLMQVEAQPQTALKNKLTAEQSNVTSLQGLNTAFAALATQAGTLAGTAAWNAVSVTSSSTAVHLVAGPTTNAGSLTFTVGGVAAASELRFTTSSALTAAVTTGSTMVRIDHLDGTTQDIDTGDGTLSGLISAVNAAGTGLKASTVHLDDGSYRLQVTSTATGAASDFALTNLDGSDLLGGATSTVGRDASITIGTDTVHSATNTFASVANGLDVSLDPTIAAGTTVTVSVAQDPGSMSDKVKGLVDAMNAVMTKLGTLTAYNSATKTSGPLATDGGVRSLGNKLLESVYPPDGTSLAGVGIQLDRFGKLTFDAATFTKAYNADPSAVAAKFTSAGNGFGARVQAAAKAASDSSTGTITTSITGRSSSIKRMQNSIADWDNRLALRQNSLTRQFTAMETALSQLNSQSNWLSGQIASLSKGS